MDEILKWQHTFKGKMGRGEESINNGFWLHMHAATLNALLLLFSRLAWVFFSPPPDRLPDSSPCSTLRMDGRTGGGWRMAGLADDFHTAASKELPSTGNMAFDNCHGVLVCTRGALITGRSDGSDTRQLTLRVWVARRRVGNRGTLGKKSDGVQAALKKKKKDWQLQRRKDVRFLLKELFFSVWNPEKSMAAAPDLYVGVQIGAGNRSPPVIYSFIYLVINRLRATYFKTLLSFLYQILCFAEFTVSAVHQLRPGGICLDMTFESFWLAL